MISAALKQTRQGTRAIKETTLSEFLPYSRHVDDETISTKDGYVFQVIKLDGFAFETADQSQINHLKRVRNTLLMGLASSRFALNYHIVRREVFDYPEPRFSGFCAVLDNTWKRKLSEKHLFVNDQYITVIRRNLTGTAGIAERLGRLVSSTADRAAEEAQQRASIKALYEATDNVITGDNIELRFQGGENVDADGAEAPDDVELLMASPFGDVVFSWKNNGDLTWRFEQSARE